MRTAGETSPLHGRKRSKAVEVGGGSASPTESSSTFMGYGELTLASSSLGASYNGLHTAPSAAYSEGAGTMAGSEVTDVSAQAAALAAAELATPEDALRVLLPVAEANRPGGVEAGMRPDVAGALEKALDSLPAGTAPVPAARAHRVLAARGKPDALQHALAGEAVLLAAGGGGTHAALLAALRVEAGAAHARMGSFAAGASAAASARAALATERAPGLELRAGLVLAECSARREDATECARAGASYAALGHALDALSAREGALPLRVKLYCARASAALRLAQADCPSLVDCAPTADAAREASFALAMLALRLAPEVDADGKTPPGRRAALSVLAQACAARAKAGVHGMREKAVAHFDEAIAATPWDDAAGHTLYELQRMRAAARALPNVPPPVQAVSDDSETLSCPSSSRSEPTVAVEAYEEQHVGAAGAAAPVKESIFPSLRLTKTKIL